MFSVALLCALSTGQVFLGPAKYGGSDYTNEELAKRSIPRASQPVWSGGHASATWNNPTVGGGYGGVYYQLQTGDPADPSPLSRNGIDVVGSVTLGGPGGVAGATQVSSGFVFCGNTVEADWTKGRYLVTFADGRGGLIPVAPSAGDSISVHVSATSTILGNGNPVCRAEVSINGTVVGSRLVSEFDHSVGVTVRLYGLKALGTPGTFSGLSVN